MEITIFQNIKETKKPYYVDIYTIIDRIKNGRSKELVEKIRSETDKKERNLLKASLPSICFSGKFAQRANDKILEHSGLLCIDFDHVQNLLSFKESLCKDKYTFICFISPSGDGLKVVVQIPANIETHAASCKALKEYYKNDSLDNFEDVARVCYESFDPEIYFNETAEIFTELYFEDKVEIKKVETHEIVRDDYDIFCRLKTWIENEEHYQDGSKHKFLVKFAGALNRFGVYESSAASFLRNTYQNAAGRVDSKDFDKIVSDVYGKYGNQRNTSHFETTGQAYEKNTKKYVSKDFFKEYQPEPKEDEYEKRIKELIQSTLIDISQPPQKQPSILSIRKDAFSYKLINLMSLGNISAIHGKWKTKKTFLISMFAAALTSNNTFSNLLYPEISENKRNVLYFDTEQSKFHSWKVADRIVKLANIKITDYFGMFSMRGKTSTDIIDLMEYYVKKANGSIACIFIDQVADLAKSINDEEEANAVIKRLEKLSNDYDLHICCVIHQNKANENATGWLGSQIMKKAETIIKISKNTENKNISIVEPDATRGEEFESFSFHINEQGMPEIITDYSDMDNKTNFK